MNIYPIHLTSPQLIDWINNLRSLVRLLFTIRATVSSDSRDYFFNCCMPRRLRLLLLHVDLTTIIHGFGVSKLDYCNSLYTVLHLKLLQK